MRHLCCEEYAECRGHGSLRFSHCAECTLVANHEGLHRWALMMTKQHPELFGDEKFYDEDELVASIQSYMRGIDLKVKDDGDKR